MKFYKWRHGRQIVLPQALIASLWLLPIAAHAESSYLHELQAEAAKTDSEQNKPAPEKNTTPGWNSHQQGLSDHIPAGLSKKQFETRLKQGFFGSHLFYSKLSDADQQKVYEDYKKNNAIDSIRESIKSHMKSEQ